MILLGISGKRRVGKDLLASFLVQDFGFTQVSLAAPLKDLCKTMFKLTEDQVNGANKEQPSQHIRSPRQIMINTGQFFRGIYPDVWIERLYETINLDHTKNYVISDVRFINEADFIKEHGGYLVRLERGEEYTGVNIDDPSETQLDNYSGFDMKFTEFMNRNRYDMAVIAKAVGQFLQCPRQ